MDAELEMGELLVGREDRAAAHHRWVEQRHRGGGWRALAGRRGVGLHHLASSSIILPKLLPPLRQSFSASFSFFLWFLLEVVVPHGHRSEKRTK